MANNQIPPLLGDGTGRYRVLVVGNSGSGKSTLATALAKELGVTCISLDKLHWNPGWRQTPADEFRIRLQEALDKDPQGWVVDGNDSRKVGGIVRENTTDIIWLDPPLLLYFPRLLIRTLKRLVFGEDLCSPGCQESIRSVFFSADSVLLWSLKHHGAIRRHYREMMSRIGLETGSDIARRRMRRFGGWGGHLKVWWRAVQALKHGKQI